MGREEAVHDFVTTRYAALRRAAFLLSGDWAGAEDAVQRVLARLVADARRGPVADPEAYAYADLARALRRRPRRRQCIYACPAPAGDDDAGSDVARAVLLLDGLRRLAPPSRAVLVLRHFAGFCLGDTADLLRLSTARVAAQEGRALAALGAAAIRPVTGSPAYAVDAAGGARPIGELFADALAGEPPVSGGPAAVYRRAERTRRRQAGAVLAAGAAGAALVVPAGYVLTGAVLPHTVPASVAGPEPAPADAVGPLVAPVVAAAGYLLDARQTDRGPGWRRYLVVDRAGRPRGTLEVTAYAAPDGLCFPVLAVAGACARAEGTPSVEYARYARPAADPPANEVIARRRGDGRTVAVTAAGLPTRPAPLPARTAPDTANRPAGAAVAPAGNKQAGAAGNKQAGAVGNKQAGTGPAPLTARDVQRLAIMAAVGDVFGPGEMCNPPAPWCPTPPVPVPAPAQP
jgi:DNA-directed RNA polymerase specialized sigma24 family protein